MKNFFKIAVSAVLITATAAFAGCKVSPKKVFERATGATLPECGLITTIDSTGWMGDGELVYIFHFEEEDGKVLEETLKTAENWSPLPMSATLDHLVYEHFEGAIPRAESGYYFFYDEQRDVYSPIENIEEDSYSYDFVIGMYNGETHTAYYYEQHT